MAKETRKEKHPPYAALMEYAEGLVGSTAQLNTHVATHVSKCIACQQQVDEMSASILVIDGVDSISTSSSFTASVLLAARKVPRDVRAKGSWLRTGLVAASIAAFAAFLPTYFMQPNRVDPFGLPQANSVQTLTAGVIPSVLVIPATPAETLLVPAVLGEHRTPGTPWERAQHRALNAYDNDIAEAEVALASNRALTRASVLISQSRARKARTLKDVYTESH